MSLRIYGAGMAGLLASEMLRHVRPIVYEAQSDLPDNHGALLRFRTDGVARETKLPFRRVSVLKAVKSGGRLRPVSSIRDANLYARKVTGTIAARSVLDLSPCERWIAPDNFISAMARDAVLKMNAPLTPALLAELKGQREIVSISTIPMPVLMKIAGWEAPEFRWRPIWSQTVDLGTKHVDVFQTLYYPEPDARQYRASITGSRLIVEWTTDPGVTSWRDVVEVLEDFGIPDVYPDALRIGDVRRQEYGKLLPLADDARREFIMAMTDEYNIYSVGRFATWRQILLDDVVEDVHHVAKMIHERSAYARRLSGLTRGV